MAKGNLSGISVTGPGANTSGLTFTRLAAGAPPTPGASALGVDVAGNIVVIGMPSFRTVLLSNTANPGSSTADVNALTATIPANVLLQGSMVLLQLSGSVQGGNSTYQFWLKIGNTKVATVAFQIGLLSTVNGFWGLRAYMTLRAAGSSGQIASYLQVLSDASNVIQSTTALTAFDSTVAQTVTAGFNWTNGANGNVVTASQGIIGPM